MEALTQEVSAAVVESIWDRMTEDAKSLLIDEARRRFLETFEQEAVSLARAQLQSEYQDLETRLRDQTARLRERMRVDLERVGDAQTEDERRKIAEEKADEISDLRAQRANARALRDAAEMALVYLTRAFFPLDQDGEPRWLYLHDYGIRQFDLALINQALSRRNLRVRARSVHGSERQILTRMADGRIEPRAQFALDAVTGDAPPEDEEE